MNMQKAEYWARKLLSDRTHDDSGGLKDEAVGYLLRELQRFREREPMVRALCGAVEDHPYGDVAPIDAWRVLVDWEMDHRPCDSSATETSDQADTSAASETENA